MSSKPGERIQGQSRSDWLKNQWAVGKGPRPKLNGDRLDCNVRITLTQKQRLQILAKEMQMSLGAVVRAAIEEYIEDAES